MQKKKTGVGVSLNPLFPLSCTQTSMLVLGGQLVSVCIALWKATKIMQVCWYGVFPYPVFVTAAAESSTEQYDVQVRLARTHVFALPLPSGVILVCPSLLLYTPCVCFT